MRKKKSSLIAAVLIAGLLAGCGNSGSAGVSGSAGESGGTDASQAQAESGQGSGNFNEFGWEVPEETLEINILDASGSYAPT